MCLFHTVLAFPASFRFTWNASFPVALTNHLSHFLLPVSILDVYHLGIDLSIVRLELRLDVSIPAVPVNYKLLEGGDMSLLASYATVGKQKCSINTCEIRKKINAKLKKKLLKLWKDPLLRISVFDDDKCLDTSVSQNEVQKWPTSCSVHGFKRKKNNLREKLCTRIKISWKC